MPNSPRCATWPGAIVEEGTAPSAGARAARDKPDFHGRLALPSIPAAKRHGIDACCEPDLRGPESASCCHPASVTRTSPTASMPRGGANVSAVFGPQHGLRGDKQDNMMESPDFSDPARGIPVFSLYGEVRRPTDVAMQTFDVLLVDLQDLGCRIYTFITTLRYVLEAAARHGKAVWVLDRPNPVNGWRRPGLRPGWESFAPDPAHAPWAHPRQLGLWFSRTLKLDVECRIVEMQGWRHAAPGSAGRWRHGWVNQLCRTCRWRAPTGTVMMGGDPVGGRGVLNRWSCSAPDIDARGSSTR
jgi:hypothetical protein